jgi:hypothetical protein
VTATVLIVGAGVVAMVIGFSKSIEPLIELGLALAVIAFLAKPTSKP